MLEVGSQGLTGARQTLPLPLSCTLSSEQGLKTGGVRRRGTQEPRSEHWSEQRAVIDLVNTGSPLATEAPEVRIR